MRVISQDGTIDIPYDSVIIQRFGRKIYFLNKNLIGVEQLISDMDIATYSTEEKAKRRLRCCMMNGMITGKLGCSNFQKMKMWRFSLCRT